MELTQAYNESYRHYLHKTHTQLKRHGSLFVKLMNTNDPIFVPKKKYLSDAGFDCRARIDQAIVIPSGERVSIPLGFAINIPMHCTGDLRPRSGLTRDYGIMIGYGTVDAGYTGEVQATVFNLGKEDFIIEPQDRIAQLVILPTAMSSSEYESIVMKQVDQLIELERGKNGHGSSGIK